jgi:hypothetical protein
MTLFGVWLSVWGTFTITKSYHPVRSGVGFLVAVLRITRLFLTGQSDKAISELIIMSRLAVNKENRERTLVGLYLVFLGFLAQGIGTAFWLADAVWGALVRTP